MTITLEELGFTKEELEERVIDQICDRVMRSVGYDPDGEVEYTHDSRFGQQINKAVQKKIEGHIEAMAEKHLIPNVQEFIETLTIQKTNQWAEKIGKPQTFKEYLIARAQHYMEEPVDWQGKKPDRASQKDQTRLMYMIDRRLGRGIEEALKDAFRLVISSLDKSLRETVEDNMKAITKGITMSVKLPR